MNNGWLIHISIKKCVFQAFTTVVGRSSAEEGCTDTNTYWKTLWILSLLRKESLLDGFLVDMDINIFCFLPQWSWFLYQTTAYCICIRMIRTVGKVNSWKKVRAINMIYKNPQTKSGCDQLIPFSRVSSKDPVMDVYAIIDNSSMGIYWINISLGGGRTK